MKLRRVIGRLAMALAASAVGLTAAQCREEHSGEPAAQLLQQVVTFTGNSEDGYVRFEYRELNDSPLIQLIAPGRISENNARPGDRLLLTYRLPSDRRPADGGEIGVAGLQHILTDTVETAAINPAELGVLYLLTINRSGEYLDLLARMPETRGRSIEASNDASPDADGLLTLWINATEGEGASEAYMTQTWASIWIGPAWNRMDISGVRVVVNNTNNPYRSEFIFKKTNL